MLFMSAMVTTMMATACVLSSLEVEGEEEVGEWDHQERDMALHPGARTTELLCPVGDVCSLCVLHLTPFVWRVDECAGLMCFFVIRSSSEWKLAGSEGSHARGR